MPIHVTEISSTAIQKLEVFNFSAGDLVSKLEIFNRRFYRRFVIILKNIYILLFLHVIASECFPCFV